MLALEEGVLEDAYDATLLDIIRALGAHMLAKSTDYDDSKTLRIIHQNLWGRVQARMFTQMQNANRDSLMTFLLSAEYATRTGQQSLAFTLGGCAIRQLQLLRYDILPDGTEEHDIQDLEQRIRFTWACYSMDARQASGVDNNAFWRQETPQVPLPSDEATFNSSTASDRLYLSEVYDDMHKLKHLDGFALMVVLMDLRKQVLR